MKRVIQEQIKRPLADDLLFGALAEGGEAQVYAPGEKDAKAGEKTLVLEVISKGREPKALPASAE